MEALFFRVLTLSLTCSVVILPLLLLGRRLRSRYAARTLWVLWLLLGVRLVVPVQFGLPQPTVVVETPRYVLQLPSVARPPVAPAVGEVIPTEAPPVATHRAVELSTLLGALWLGGAVLFLTGQVVVYLAARRRLLRSARPANSCEAELLDAIKTQLGVVRPVTLLRGDKVRSPLTLGLVRPVILLSERAMEPQALAVVLRHELCHLRRRDLAYKGLLLLCNAVHWFNPLVWAMSREAAHNLELCCDDEVLRGTDTAARRQYGEVLLAQAAGGRAPALGTQFGSEKRQLKERLSNLFQEKRTGAMMVCLVLTVAVILGATVAFQPGELVLTTPVIPSDENGLGEEEEINLSAAGSEASIPNDSAANILRMAEKPFGEGVPLIDYADKEFIIFHDDWGLIVYDLRQEQIVRALDTSSVGMNLMQGDQYTEVKVGKDLDQILLYHSPGKGPEDVAYRYDLEMDQIWRTTVGETAGFETVPESKRKIKEPTGMGELFGPWSGYVTEDEGKTVYLTFPKNNEGLTMKDLVIWTENEIHPVFDATPDWQWPVQTAYGVTEPFSATFDESSDTYLVGNNGVDLMVNMGSNIYSALDGVVISVGGHPEVGGDSITIQHRGGWTTYYAGLSFLMADLGDSVRAGYPVGGMGDRVTLHFEVQRTTPSAWEVYDPVALIIEKDATKRAVGLTEPDTGWLWPLEGRYTIMSSYGPRIHPITEEKINHDGTDIAAPEGTPVQAARGGTVQAVYYDEVNGNCVDIGYPDLNMTMVYGALSDAAVQIGDEVVQGQVIGYTGSTGTSTGTHLHFGLWKNGSVVDVLMLYPNLLFNYYTPN